MRIKVWMGMLLGSLVLAGGMLVQEAGTSGTTTAGDDPMLPGAAPVMAADDPMPPGAALLAEDDPMPPGAPVLAADDPMLPGAAPVAG